MAIWWIEWGWRVSVEVKSVGNGEEAGERIHGERGSECGASLVGE